MSIYLPTCFALLTVTVGKQADVMAVVRPHIHRDATWLLPQNLKLQRGCTALAVARDVFVVQGCETKPAQPCCSLSGRRGSLAGMPHADVSHLAGWTVFLRE